MKTYLEIKVPLMLNVQWYKNLINALCRVNTRWQKGFWHITAAFLDDAPEDVDVASIIDKHLSKVKPMMITLDTLGVFAIPSGQSKIVYLTSSNPPSELLKLIENIREDLRNTGCTLSMEFKLHVTLGRIFDDDYDVPTLQTMIEEVSHSPFSCTLIEADYREFRGRELQSWYFYDSTVR
ncbi:MAG: 2'-5' RNA ligase family protein [Prevotella sp.]|nr:2'-5' RNA ligase family protein [Candidatus Prevotella equi]